MLECVGDTGQDIPINNVGFPLPAVMVNHDANVSKITAESLKGIFDWFVRDQQIHKFDRFHHIFLQDGVDEINQIFSIISVCHIDPDPCGLCTYT